MSTGLAGVSPDRMHLALIRVLTLGTGVVDGDGLPVLGPLRALAGFMAGAAPGGRVLRDAPHAWIRRTNLLLTLVGLLVLVSADRMSARTRG